MPKLDKNNKLMIPKEILALAKTDFNKDVRLYLKGNEFFLDHTSYKNRRFDCMGKISVDNEGCFYIPEAIQEILHINKNSNLLCFLYEDRITFRKVTIIPELR